MKKTLPFIAILFTTVYIYVKENMAPLRQGKP